MQFSIIAVFTTLVALSLAAPAPQRLNRARQDFRDNQCQAQACRDAVDQGCPLFNINFNLGCDLDGNVGK